MQNAETVLGVLRERGRRGLPLERTVSTTVQPAVVSAGLRAHLRQPRRDDARGHGGNRGRHVPGEDRTHHRRAAPRALPVHARSGGSTSRKRTGRRARWGCRPGRTSWSAKWSACCWRRTTSRSSPTAPTVSVPAGAATPRCARWPTPGPGRPGSSRETSPTASGQLDHEVMLAILAEKIHDNRFLRLMRNMLTAGYLEDWSWHATLCGAPQGGVASPILSNIYLDRLDQFVETVLIPEYTRGDAQGTQPGVPEAAERSSRKARRRGDRAAGADAAAADASACPARTRTIPGYRRLRYCRYADDHLLGFAGPKAEAEQIKQRLAEFLRDELKLELSDDKTLITHARTGAARFLGYEITAQHADTRSPAAADAVNGQIALRVPRDGDQGQMRPLPARAANPRNAERPDQRRRLHHRRHLRGRVPGHRPVLPAGRGRLPAGPAALGHGDLDAQDPGRQAPLVGDRRWPPSTRPRSRHRTGYAPASRHASNAMAGSHWSHGSAAYHSSGRRRRRSSTASRSGSTIRTRS